MSEESIENQFLAVSTSGIRASQSDLQFEVIPIGEYRSVSHREVDAEWIVAKSVQLALPRFIAREITLQHRWIKQIHFAVQVSDQLLGPIFRRRCRDHWLRRCAEVEGARGFRTGSRIL